MARELRYVEFAKALGVSRASVAMAIKNRQIDVDTKNKLIDVQLAKNKLWIQNQLAKGKTWDLNRIDEKEIIVTKPAFIQQKKEVDEDEYDNVQESKPVKNKKKSVVIDEDQHLFQLQQLDLQKKIEDLRKIQNDNELSDIKIKKLNGELIPADAVTSIFIFSVETFRTQYTQEVEAMASIFVERLGCTDKHYKEIQKELTEKINDTLKDVKDQLFKGVATVIDEYKEVRGRGERK